MLIEYYKRPLISLLFLISTLNSTSINCISALQEEEQGCSILSILEKTTPPFKIREEPLKIKEVLKKEIELKITKNLAYINVTHENQEVVINRTPKDAKHTCPPFCIQPMNIKGVKTVGELEVLTFIQELKKEEAKLLIDIRTSKEYKEHTIPSAINIPYTMLKSKSKYQKDVLTLLGGEKDGKEWKFKHIPVLLIFGTNEESPEASEVIKTLLKFSYPTEKILFYRAGIDSWKRLGLTIY